MPTLPKMDGDRPIGVIERLRTGARIRESSDPPSFPLFVLIPSPFGRGETQSVLRAQPFPPILFTCAPSHGTVASLPRGLRAARNRLAVPRYPRRRSRNLEQSHAAAYSFRRGATPAATRLAVPPGDSHRVAVRRRVERGAGGRGRRGRERERGAPRALGHGAVAQAAAAAGRLRARLVGLRAVRGPLGLELG